MSEVDKLIEIVRDESKSDKERIEAAKKLWSMYINLYPFTKEEYMKVSSLLLSIVPEPLDKNKVYDTVKVGKFASKIEEVVWKGLYELYDEMAQEEVERAEAIGIREVANLFAEGDKFVKEKARVILRERPEEMAKEVEVYQYEVSLKKIRVMEKEIEALAANIPRIKNPMSLKFLSKAQVNSIKKPSKWYALEAFRNGIWKESWGDPEDYGIRLDTNIRYAEPPQNLDFVKMCIFKGIWNDKWGSPMDWLKKLKE